MKSIRVSLIVYFLALLVVGLGGVSLLAYRISADTFEHKEASERTLLKNETLARCAESRKEFDDQLVRKAKQIIARYHRPGRVDWTNSMGMLGSALMDHGYIHLASNAQLSVGKVSGQLTFWKLRMLDQRPLDQILTQIPDVPGVDRRKVEPQEYCQTFTRWGEPWEHTGNLGWGDFQLDETFRKKGEVNQSRFDQLPLENSQIRFVTIKVPRPFNIPAPMTKWKDPRVRDINMRAMSEPYYFIQFGMDMSLLEDRIAAIQESQAGGLARLTETTATALGTLKGRLFVLCGLTLLAVLGGGFILVYLGLAPLHRLSEAVSQVSEKDFRLKLSPESLPTELQPIAHRLTRTLEQLQGAFAREKQSAQDISHDLRTPLAALTTTLEVALRKERTSAEYRELLGECQLSANQMAHLVERLLALAKVDSGSNPVRSRNVDICQVAQHASDLVRPLAKAREIGLFVRAPEELRMRADPDKLCEILTNLLHNAIDYNRPAGSIYLTVEQKGSTLEVEVADTGIGILPEAKPRLFERFYRADPSRHVDTPHCGLGLAIVKSYVDLMNGTVQVESEVGVGTTFRLTFPFVPPISEEMRPALA